MSIRSGLAAALCLALGGGNAAADPVTFKDMRGREVKLDKPAERVASIVIPMASTLIALDGRTDRLVGMNPVAKVQMLGGILAKMFRR